MEQWVGLKTLGTGVLLAEKRSRPPWPPPCKFLPIPQVTWYSHADADRAFYFLNGVLVLIVEPVESH